MRNLNHQYFALPLLTLFLFSCSMGGGETGTGAKDPDPTVANGTVTGFGSVYVNGIKFETNPATTSYTLDGVSADESQLSVGMVVSIEGKINADGTTGSASHIRYEDEIEGKVTSALAPGSNTGQIIVVGQTVHIATDTRVDGVLSADLISVGQRVEVSGFNDGNGNVYATRIETKSDTSDQEELKGKVSALDSNATTFQIGQQLIQYNGAAFEDFNTVSLENGQVVEVKGTIDTTNNTLIAEEIELKDRSGRTFSIPDDVTELEIEGIVTSALQSNTFAINGQTVSINSATEFEPNNDQTLQVGEKAEVDIVVQTNGELLATKIEKRQSAKLEIAGIAEISSSNSDCIVILNQTICTTNNTIFEDKSNSQEFRFRVASLATGSRYLEVKAFSNNGQLIATEIEREDEDGEASQIKGLVQSVDIANNLIVLEGDIQVTINNLSALNLIPGDEIELEVSLNADLQIVASTVESEKPDDDD